jgi:phage gpG-like protein
MAGVFIGLEKDFETKVLEQLKKLQVAGKSLKPVFDDIGEILKVSHKDRWPRQESPAGARWAGLSPVTLSRKTQNVDKILVQEKNLRDYLRYQNTNSKFRFGTLQEYGTTHQFGAKQG